MKITTASTTPMTIVMPISLPVSCSSSVSPMSEAETWKAFMASASVSTIATQPRTIGQRIHAALSLPEARSCSSEWISPEGVRTATAQL